MAKRKKAAQAEPEVTPKSTKRGGVKPPDESKYTFEEGDQVALVNLRRPADQKVRTHYEYVRRAGKMDVVKNTKNGELHRVWLNKLIPIGEAKKLINRLAQEAATKENAA